MELRLGLDKLRERAPFVPEVALVLGSGLGVLAEGPDAAGGVSVPFTDLGLPAQTVQGHQGRLVFCVMEGRKVVLQAGRFHYYEGNPMALVTAPMRLLARLGVKAVVHTNAAGAINAAFRVGQLMLITDHINLMGVNPLVGPNTGPGPRFPDLSAAYDPGLSGQLARAAVGLGQTLQQGVYLAVSGPSYETPAEIRAFRTLGADAVGMSTVPEVIVARQEGMKVAGLSCLCNMAAGMLPEALTHAEVLAAGAGAGVAFELLIRAFLRAFEDQRGL